LAGLPKCFEGAEQKEVSCAGLRGPARAARAAVGGGIAARFAALTPPTAARAVLYGSLRMAADSWGVMGMFWGLLACVHVSRSRRSSMSGGAAGCDSQGRVHVVGNVPARVPGGGEALPVELQIGVDTAGRYVVLIRQIMQCARIVGECAANKAMSTHRSALATLLGHGHALEMATWGKHKQCTCEVKHVAAVLEWAAEGYGGINVLGPEQRAELAEAVQKTVFDLARKELTCMTGLHWS